MLKAFLKPSLSRSNKRPTKKMRTLMLRAKTILSIKKSGLPRDGKKSRILNCTASSRILVWTSSV